VNGKNLSNTSKTDWDRVDALRDEDIDTSDIPPLPEDFFSGGRLRLPPASSRTALHLDQEVAQWLQGQEEDWEKLANEVLRRYMEAQETSRL
jgi:uncharacterized protein (DUF4415 family)